MTESERTPKCNVHIQYVDTGTQEVNGNLPCMQNYLRNVCKSVIQLFCFCQSLHEMSIQTMTVPIRFIPLRSVSHYAKTVHNVQCEGWDTTISLSYKGTFFFFPWPHLLQSICHPVISEHDGFLVNGKRAGATDWLLWHVQAFSWLFAFNLSRGSEMPFIWHFCVCMCAYRGWWREGSCTVYGSSVRAHLLDATFISAEKTSSIFSKGQV